MTRINQILNKKNCRSRKTRLQKDILGSNPQKRAICLKLTTMSPKKPNSANRRIAKVNLVWSNKKINVKIPGENHNLQQHSTILIRGSRVRDLIGVNSSAIRGKLDLYGVQNRKTSRSVYGVKLKT